MTRLSRTLILLPAALLFISIPRSGSAATLKETPPAAVATACAPTASERGEEKGRAIHEERFLTVGGIQQWITINGASCANPEAPEKELIIVPQAGHDPNEAIVEAQYKALKEL